MDESEPLKLKAHLVIHGNRECERYSVRRDLASANLLAIRLIFSLAKVLNFDIVIAYLKGAYMQSGPIADRDKRELFVSSPGQIGIRQRIIWRLIRLPYRIVEVVDSGCVQFKTGYFITLKPSQQSTSINFFTKEERMER